jgi:hypothetical protein
MPKPGDKELDPRPGRPDPTDQLFHAGTVQRSDHHVRDASPTDRPIAAKVSSIGAPKSTAPTGPAPTTSWSRHTHGPGSTITPIGQRDH